MSLLCALCIMLSFVIPKELQCDWNVVKLFWTVLKCRPANKWYCRLCAIVCCWFFDIDLNEKRKREMQSNTHSIRSHETKENGAHTITKPHTNSARWVTFVWGEWRLTTYPRRIVYLHILLRFRVCVLTIINVSFHSLSLTRSFIHSFFRFCSFIGDRNSVVHTTKFTEEMSKVTLVHINILAYQLGNIAFDINYSINSKLTANVTKRIGGASVRNSLSRSFSHFGNKLIYFFSVLW